MKDQKETRITLSLGMVPLAASGSLIEPVFISLSFNVTSIQTHINFS